METLTWVINTPGIGGLMVLGVFSICFISYFLTLRWIKNAADLDMSQEESVEGEAVHEAG